MRAKSAKFINTNAVVGPIDRIFRAAIAAMVIIISFTLPLTIFEFALMSGATIYFFFTGLTRWDPFYAIFYKIWQTYKENAAINGRF